MAHFDLNLPLNEEPDGTYITGSQMQFFINQKDGLKMFKELDEEFLEYYNMCRVYNLISEHMDNDPDSAIMYWDPKKKIVSLGFPSKGAVAQDLAGLQPSVLELSDGESGEWGDGVDYNG